MKLQLLLAVCAFLTFQSFSQVLPPKQAYPIDVKQIHSGHSLTDPLFHPWPGQYRHLVYNQPNGVWDNLGKSTIPGSPMWWRWNNENTLTPSARYNIADWELLVITEGIPIPDDGGNPATIAPAKEALRDYVNNAWNNGNNGNGAATLLWTTWTEVDGGQGPWRQTLDTYEAHWEEMMDFANANRPNGATPVYIIPGHRMMARLYDDIQNNLVPGVDSIQQFFSDDIHMNDWGAYAVAMIHYACIYNTSPVGLPNVLFDNGSVGNHNPPSQQLATYLQTMIWDVVTSYDRTGITGTITSTKPTEKKEPLFSIYPNPATNFINIKTASKGLIKILNTQGKVLYQGYDQRISLEKYTAGLYFIQVENQTKKFIKK